MMPHCFLFPARRALLTIGLLWTLAGCSDGVREDRSINFSRQSGDVAFQHGRDGVYVADARGEGLEKVFDVGDDVLAVSSPNWAPGDKRLIFTTAVADKSSSESPGMNSMPRWDANPAGNLYFPQPITYTCWLRAAPQPGENGSKQPVALFQASCDHAGYVAANLAADWHPDGKRILYVDRTKDGRHGLFEFHLDNAARNRVFPQSAEALTFGWSPRHTYLWCMPANKPQQPYDGIWIRPRDDGDWWLAPGSERLADSRSRGLLEQLRATRPAWTADDQRFAFAVAKFGDSRQHGESAQSPGGDAKLPEIRYEIRVVELESREMSVVFQGGAPVRDLHWHPGGRRLGFVEDGESSALRILHLATDDQEPMPAVLPNVAGPVRRFAGWNHDGSRLAYVTPDAVPTHGAEKNWALLLPPVRDPRDRVYVIEDAGGERGPGRMVHSGMRITLPQWSPLEDRLSLWGTFTPTHRSLLPRLLRPGDPAAILDGDDGKIHWMAVNADEKAQVGNYHLLRREYEEAWRWYGEAAEGRPAEGRPAPRPLRIDDFLEIQRRLRDTTFFEYYCLSKLGRQQEAAERLASFRTSLKLEFPELRGESGTGNNEGESNSNGDEELQRFAKYASAVVQDLYIAEAFLSVDALDDGIAFFREEVRSAENDAQQLAAALCLSQLLLLSEDYPEYLRVVSGTLAPRLISLHETLQAPDGSDVGASASSLQALERQLLLWLGGAALMPLFSPEFLESCPEPVVRKHVKHWQAERNAIADSDVLLLAIDLFLHAAYERLGDAVQRDKAAQRAGRNPALKRFGGDFSLDDLPQVIEQARQFHWD
jgi:hypothetical protein